MCVLCIYCMYIVQCTYSRYVHEALYSAVCLLLIGNVYLHLSSSKTGFYVYPPPGAQDLECRISAQVWDYVQEELCKDEITCPV